jgi:hypothetical protein
MAVTKKQLAVALFAAAATGAVVSCGGGGGGTVTATAETPEETKAVLEGTLPPDLAVDEQNGDVKNSTEEETRATVEGVVTDVWAIVDNQTYYSGYFVERNGTYYFEIPDIPAGKPYVITFVNGTPNNLENETIVAVTPPIVVTNSTAVLKLTDVENGIVSVDVQTSLGVEVKDDETIRQQLAKIVGKAAKEALDVIANTTQVVEEQMENATQENATQTVVTDGWYKNYAVGLYETKYAFDVKDANNNNNNNIGATKLVTAVVDGQLYVVTDNKLYKVDLTKNTATNNKNQEFSTTIPALPTMVHSVLFSESVYSIPSCFKAFSI